MLGTQFTVRGSHGATPLRRPEIKDRLAAMLNHFNLQLNGPKCAALKVDNKEKYHFDPRTLLMHTAQIYVRLSTERNDGGAQHAVSALTPPPSAAATTTTPPCLPVCSSSPRYPPPCLHVCLRACLRLACRSRPWLLARILRHLWRGMSVRTVPRSSRRWPRF